MTEKENKVNFFMQEVEKNLKKELKNYKFDEKNKIFVLDNNVVFKLTSFTLQGDTVIAPEYADSYEQALRFMSEDGRCYSIEHFTIEEITQGIIEEAVSS